MGVGVGRESRDHFLLQDEPEYHAFFPEPSFRRSCFPLDKRSRTFSLVPCGPPSSILGRLPGPGAQGPPGGTGGTCVEPAQSWDVREKGHSQGPTPCPNLTLLPDSFRRPELHVAEPGSRTRAHLAGVLSG